MADKSKVLSLLQQLASEGASVKDARDTVSPRPLTSDALASMASDDEDFTAWITWTKSF